MNYNTLSLLKEIKEMEKRFSLLNTSDLDNLLIIFIDSLKWHTVYELCANYIKELPWQFIARVERIADYHTPDETEFEWAIPGYAKWYKDNNVGSKLKRNEEIQNYKRTQRTRGSSARGIQEGSSRGRE